MERRQIRDCDSGQRLQDLHEAPREEHIPHRLHGVQVGSMSCMHSKKYKKSCTVMLVSVKVKTKRTIRVLELRLLFQY
jgi:hypothetical protein